jgi:hypothetical protein
MRMLPGLVAFGLLRSNRRQLASSTIFDTAPLYAHRRCGTIDSTFTCVPGSDTPVPFSPTLHTPGNNAAAGSRGVNGSSVNAPEAPIFVTRTL